MCFGVRDAISLAKRVVKSRPLTVLGELVHNSSVLNDLRDRGVQFEEQPGEIETETVMITAHGASEQAKKRARESGLSLRDATCPLVHHAHKKVRELVTNGYHPVVIGRRGHGVNETFTVRRISYGEGVERVFPVNSPRIEKLVVERQGKVRRAKLNYLRERIGKRALAVKASDKRR